jgi:hypothetical protein
MPYICHRNNKLKHTIMATLSISDIKRNYPDEWILLGSPEINEKEQTILSAVVLYHSPDKMACFPRASGTDAI